jgi:O-antigen ligase
MRKITRALLLLLTFAIPWEYSLDLGAPFGNIARLVGLTALAVAVSTVLLEGRWRSPGPLLWWTLGLYLWFCCTYFWSVAPDATLMKLRGYFQQMMILWLAWEFVDTPDDLRNLLRAWLAGSWVLVLLTFVDFVSLDPTSADQIRFAAAGNDPNDAARFVDLGFPIAALLMDRAERRIVNVFALGYPLVGFAAVLLTGSRSGLLTALVALAGSTCLVFQRYPKRVVIGALTNLPAIGALLWSIVPRQTFDRLGTILQQLQSGDLNQRANIWSAGWRAFAGAPLRGHGAGSFVIAAGLAPIDTAHNTVLSILVEGGICALLPATAIVVFSAHMILATRGPLRIALITLVSVLFVSSLVGTVAENRITWLLLAVVALSCRFEVEQPERLYEIFPSATLALESQPSERFP